MTVYALRCLFGCLMFRKPTWRRPFSGHCTTVAAIIVTCGSACSYSSRGLLCGVMGAVRATVGGCDPTYVADIQATTEDSTLMLSSKLDISLMCTASLWCKTVAIVF